MTQKDQLAVCYAAFVLAGQGAEITAETIHEVLYAAGIIANGTVLKAVAKALKGRNITDFFGVGPVGASSDSAPTPAPAEKPVAKVAEKKEEKKQAPPPPPPKEEEEDMDMGGLFD